MVFPALSPLYAACALAVLLLLRLAASVEDAMSKGTKGMANGGVPPPATRRSLIGDASAYAGEPTAPGHGLVAVCCR